MFTAYVSTSELVANPTLVRRINRDIRYCQATVSVTIDLGGIHYTLPVEEVHTRKGKVYVIVKESSWRDAEELAKLIRESGGKASVLYQYDKPHVKIQLDPNSVIEVTVDDSLLLDEILD